MVKRAGFPKPRYPPRRMPYRPLPPMDEAEYRGVIRSLLCKAVVALVGGLAVACLAYYEVVRFDVISAGLLGALFLFCIGSKFFSAFLPRQSSIAPM